MLRTNKRVQFRSRWTAYKRKNMETNRETTQKHEQAREKKNPKKHTQTSSHCQKKSPMKNIVHKTVKVALVC